MTTPYSENTEATYENFVAMCPHCGHRNIYNRASDLGTLEPIAFRTVTCLESGCRHEFNINSDRINPAHQMLLFDCYEFIQHKQYMQCVLTVAQAYEVFFSHFLRVQLVYRPFATGGNRDIMSLNRLGAQLYERVQQLTFEPMRRLFLRLVVEQVQPATLAAAERVVTTLPKRPKEVPVNAIQAFPEASLRELLIRLHATDVSKLRNRVVHKDAYRPTQGEAIRAHDEAGKILHGLTAHLRLKGDANWYTNQPGR